MNEKQLLILLILKLSTNLEKSFLWRKEEHSMQKKYKMKNQLGKG